MTTDTLNAPALHADAIFAPGCVAGVTCDQIAALRGKALSRLDYGRGRHVQIDGSTLLDLLAIAEAFPAARSTTPSPAAPDWLPIETAPRDGRTLLLGSFNQLGKWRTMRGQWMSEDYIDQNWEEPDSGEPGWFETSVEADDVPNCWPIVPTRWQPLPAAPVSPNTASGEA